LIVSFEDKKCGFSHNWCEKSHPITIRKIYTVFFMAAL